MRVQLFQLLAYWQARPFVAPSLTDARILVAVSFHSFHLITIRRVRSSCSISVITLLLLPMAKQLIHPLKTWLIQSIRCSILMPQLRLVSTFSLKKESLKKLRDSFYLNQFSSETRGNLNFRKPDNHQDCRYCNSLQQVPLRLLPLNRQQQLQLFHSHHFPLDTLNQQ